jgi:hypothetical protein
MVMVLAAPVLIAAVLVLSGAGERASQEVREPQLSSPLPAQMPVCRLRGETALARARGLEALAEASWERVPFAAEEAPKAVLHMTEAESCYRAGFDRAGWQRAAVKRQTYEADVMRRWARARLLLELARRDGHDAAMRRELATLRALSSRAGEDAEAYRAWLAQQERAAEARLLPQREEED